MTESKSEQTNDLQKVEEKARKVLSNENDAIDSAWASIAHDINHMHVMRLFVRVNVVLDAFCRRQPHLQFKCAVQ